MAPKEKQKGGNSFFSDAATFYLIVVLIFAGAIFKFFQEKSNFAEAEGRVAGASSVSEIRLENNFIPRYSEKFKVEAAGKIKVSQNKREAKYQVIMEEYEAAQPKPQPKPVPVVVRKRIIRPIVRVSLHSCPIKNHRPSKSSSKGHHMDEDCCLDQDESRNPACRY